MKKSKVTAYIDADILLHRAVSFCDDDFDGEPLADWGQAEKFFDMLLAKWIKEATSKVKLEDYQLIISVGPNFRKDLYPDYKGNRKDIVPHPAFEGLKKSIMERDGVVWELGIEADDLIGIRCSEDPERTLAISADKDFATIPCQLMIPTSHGRKVPDWYTFSEHQANHNWLIQTMKGDTIDNYKGIPGVGQVKAMKVLPAVDDLTRMWPQVVAAFINAKLTEQDALLMARLARILRAGDYDFDTKEVKLWSPSDLS